MKTLLLALDLGGTFVFALSGALAAVRRRLDIFGVLVLAVAAATSGGVARDLLIGAVPPAAIRDWRYLAAAIVAGVITFRWAALIEKLQNPVRMFDAAGL
ncbi:MAG TPA: TRIC cation channel family protein, partial [Dokdonella sp.]